jgi:hypothetical protein
MKKATTLLFLGLYSATSAFAQSTENNLRNFRFGLKVMPALTWYKPDETNKFENGGARLNFGYGLMTEFRLNKVAVIATGFQIDYDGGRINFKDTAYYYINRDSELLEKEDTASSGGVSLYRLRKREYNVTYVTIPLTLKLKSNEVGQFTYYGQFGLNLSVRTRGRVNDELLTASGAPVNQSKILNTRDMQLFKLALNVGLGAEYNLSGSTSLTFGINYINGFTNVVKGDSRYLFRSRFNDYNPLKQNFRANAVALTVGVLF